MRLALFTTVYPAALPFLEAFGKSMELQTRLDFDLWITLDGLQPSDVIARSKFLSRARFIESPPFTSPAQIRSDGLTRIVDECDAVVLVDSDDVLLPTRVDSAIAAVQEHDLSAVAMELVDVSGIPLGQVLDPAIEGQNIVRKNVFGLSNTTWRSSVLKECLPLPRECRLADWMLATNAYLRGASTGFDSTPRMLYRRHGKNIAPLFPPFSAEHVRIATDLVLGHYSLLERAAWMNCSDQKEEFKVAQVEVSYFAHAIHNDPEVLQKYTTSLNALPPTIAWWACVAHPGLEYIWRS